MLKGDHLKLILLVLASIAIPLVVAEMVVGYIVPLRDVGPSFSRYDPVYGQSLRPNFSTVRTNPEFTMRLSTNAFGFRGPEIDAVPSGGILFLGDSFTMGYGVSDGDEFPALVAAKLKESGQGTSIPVVNAGVGGTGNGRWIKLLDRMGASLAPRAVVMQVLENDFDDNLRERLFELTPEGTLRELDVPSPGLGRRFQILIEAVPGLASTNLVGLLREVRLPRFGGTAEPPPGAFRAQDALTLHIIERAVALCRENGWPVIGLSVGLEGARQAAIREVFIAGGAELIEFPGKSARPDLYFRIDGHWNPAGHVDAAEQIFERLKRIGAVGG
jgi:lysophospholipase L1-like esterase